MLPRQDRLRDAATGVIEGDLADNCPSRSWMPACEDPSANDVGTTFSCTATPEGEELTFNAEIRDGDEVFVYTTNYDRVARILIEGQLATSLGREPDGHLRAACVGGRGDHLRLHRRPAGGDTVAVDATVQEGGEVAVQTTNLLTSENLANIESSGADPERAGRRDAAGGEHRLRERPDRGRGR